MILDSACISLTLEPFPKEVEPDPAVILRSVKGRTSGAAEPEFCSVSFSWLCTSGEGAEQPGAVTVEGDNGSC